MVARQLDNCEVKAAVNQVAEIERFVDGDEAATFLSLTRRRILELARAGRLPAYPIGDGMRRVWRFRLSELAAAMTSTVFTSSPEHLIHKPVACPRRGG